MPERYTPAFYRQFKCLADTCPDTCCSGWGIQIDRHSYQTYLAHPHLRIKAEQHIQPVRQSDAVWARMTLTESGRCPFLEDSGWCEIQRIGGEAMLSETCRRFPRETPRFGAHIRRSMSLSCPAVAEAVLFDPLAMQLDVDTCDTADDAPPLPAEVDTLQAAALELLGVEGLSVEAFLVYLGLMVQQSQTLSGAALGHFCLDALDLARQKPEVRDALPYLPEVQWLTLDKMTALFAPYLEQGTGRGQQWLARCQASLIEALSGRGVVGKVAHLHQAWDETVAPFLRAHPQLLPNYLFYRLYHDGFPGHPQYSVAQCYRLFVLDLFMLRSFLSAWALKCGAIDRQDVVTLFYGYHTLHQHGYVFLSHVDATLKCAGMTLEAAMFGLLSRPGGGA